MKDKQTRLSMHIYNYFNIYLSMQRGYTSDTISSYKNSFEIFFKFCESIGIKVYKMELSDITEELIEKYLTYLKNERKNSDNTINQRLNSIKNFLHYIYNKEPAYMYEFNKILEIPLKKFVRKEIQYISVKDLKLLFRKPNLKTRWGRRDLALLTMLYDTAARVNEFINIKVNDIVFTDQNNATVTLLYAKGRKQRTVPIISNTVKILQKYIEENNLDYKSNVYLFTNRSSKKLTANGVNYVIKKYSDLVREETKTFPLNVSAHVFRHTKAMHMAEAGLPQIFIKEFLGHSHLSTTEIYAQTNIELKRRVLEQVHDKQNDITNIPYSWKKRDSLLDSIINMN